MASIGATLKHLVSKSKRKVPKMDSIDEEDSDLPLTPKKFEESFLKVQQELLHLKDQISHQSKSNFRLEKDLRFLDSKIALLINHKITVEELENRVFDDHSPPTFLGNKKDLKHTELYGRLFFLLQTSPEYIAHLMRQVSLREIDGLLQIIMFTLYGNQYENREEHLLLSMFEHALTYEVQEATEINSLMRANTAITRMMTTYCRRGPGQEYVKTTLGDIILKLIAYDKSLEVDPLKIYQEMIDNEEVTRPAEADKLLLEAETNPKVRQMIAEHVPVLQDFVLRILKRLKDTIENVPFGIRWLCKATWSLVHEKFPDTQPDTLNALIGGFFFLRYINPIIATPYACRLVNNPPPSQARRNLTLVAKVIQKLASTSSMDVRESYMKPLELFVREHHEGLKTFLNNLCEVPDFHESLQLEEYVALCRNDICIEIAISELANLHKLLLKYQESIHLGEDDPLSELLRDIPEPTDEMVKNEHTCLTLDLIHGSRETIDLPTYTPHGVSLDVSDEMATTRRQCKHLLHQLFAMAPHCLQEDDLDAALDRARLSPLEDVRSNTELTSSHISTLKELGGLVHQGRDLYQEIKTNSPDMKQLLLKARTELKSLRNIYQTMEDHTDYLREQLDAYKEYLVAVRTKVGGVKQSGNNHAFRKSRSGVFRFSHQQLEKEGVILETTGIPEQRRRSISYTLSSPDPGTYIISMHYKGHQKAIYEKNINLEDLLELQHLQDPVIDMEGFVVLNVRRTLLLLNRHFMRRESSSRPLSRHFSTSALTLSSTKLNSSTSSSPSNST